MKLKVGNIIIFIVGVLVVSFSLFFLLKKEEENLLINLTNKSLEEVMEYASLNNIKLNKTYEYDDLINKDYVISQSIEENTKIEENMEIDIVISKGIDYVKYEVNELGRVPIMMYHGIQNMKDSETDYTGGNIDYSGYHRTSESFRKDLEFYYKNGYRMVRLNDYVNGIIDVELGKSPIVLTFDDGLSNNIKVTGLDENGNIIIDPNSAVGILEEFKSKYPDFNVTATFFVNGGLFNQNEYNEKIMKWLIDNGYDIGNHTYSHVDFTTSTKEQSIKEVATIYQMLDKIIENKYVKIVALPYGSPYSLEHDNFKHILKGNYEGYEYETISTLRVGWESDYSPFSKSFDKTFLKRIRAYDNKGVEFDIEMNFKMLESNRYISDGNKDVITYPKDDTYLGKSYNLKINVY